MPLPKRAVVHTLISKLGAIEERKTGHEIYKIWDGKTLVGWAKISHGRLGKDISDNILSKIARTLGVDSKTFRQIVDCTLVREDYLSLVRASKDA